MPKANQCQDLFAVRLFSHTDECKLFKEMRPIFWEGDWLTCTLNAAVFNLNPLNQLL